MRYLVALCMLVGCGLPTKVDPSNIHWAEYTNPNGYSLSYPAEYKPETNDGEVIFRYYLNVPMLVRWTDEAGAQGHDLWFGHAPVMEMNLAGVNGKKYIYDHHDGPSSSRTVSYVIPFKGKFLALEFRTEGELDSAEKRVLDSFSVNP